MNTRPYITCDLDSTVCNTSQRHHMIDRVNGTDWAAYSLQCGNDLPFEAVVAMLIALQQTVDVYYVSGRDAVAYDATEHWLLAQGLQPKGIFLDHGTWDQNFETHAHYKLDRIREVELKRGGRALFHIDDLPSVGTFLRANGVPCIIVDPMYPNSDREYIV